MITSSMILLIHCGINLCLCYCKSDP